MIVRKQPLSLAALALMLMSGCGSNQTPGTPTGLSVTATKPAITLSWTAAPNASSYNVYRGTAAGILNKTLLASGVSAVTYTDGYTAAGTTYYYQVTSFNSNGQSTPTPDVSATLDTFALTGTVASGQNQLTWPAVVSAATYSVYRSTATTVIASKTLLVSGITTATYTDTAVTAGTTYYYQVEAFDSSSNGLQVSSELSLQD